MLSLFQFRTVVTLLYLRSDIVQYFKFTYYQRK